MKNKNLISLRVTKMPIDVSVVIPILNDEERLAICLDSIQKQNTHYNYEVIVIDNGSLNPPVSLIKKYSFVKLFFEVEAGSYCARNAGLKYARGSIIAFTDSDCIASPDWIENAMATFTYRNCDMLAGKIILHSKNPTKPTATELFEKIFAFNQEDNVNKGFAVTANLFVQKYVFDKQGPFYQNTKSGGDYIFTRRATRKGFRLIYDDRVIIYHPARNRLREQRAKLKRIIKGFYTLKKVEPEMANQFSIISILKHLLPPVLSFRLVFSLKKNSIKMNAIDCFKIIFVIYHNKLFSFLYKMKVILKHG